MYSVVFEGLACFSKKDGKGRLVLLPDGREPGEGIDPHIPRLVVRTDDVDTIPKGFEIEQDENFTTIKLPKCTLHFEGADTPDISDATLDTTDHNNFVPRLSDIDPAFDGEARDNAVVKLRIRKGKLTAFTHPGLSDEELGDDPAIVSRLDVPHRGMVDITVVRAEEFAAPAVIRLLPRAEIVLTNSAPQTDELNTRSHFLIYGKLSSREVDLTRREQNRPDGLLRLPTGHPFFAQAGHVGLRGDCANTGCC